MLPCCRSHFRPHEFIGLFSVNSRFLLWPKLLTAGLRNFQAAEALFCRAESGLLADWIVDHDCLCPAFVGLPLP
jgi:hypothetical protein